ncbi:TonB-dependent receptor domain-containing protein [Phenylobacterium sp.]|uniref:TonB-dependent receptor domain-containing protein n=1 Tax=Phenylobacterium sp. TaxID=1871053 RepID=UPI002D000E66|nr:TonB-dependent receptor [Phenylobacterium sp.]HLZ76852.1 TonB-dependent receptor [Phenylobacterium sp.]
MAYRRFCLAGAMAFVLPGAALAQAQTPVQPAPAQPPAGAGDAAQAAPAKPPAKPPAPATAKAAAPAVKTVDTITVTGLVPDEKSTIDTKSYTLSKDLLATTGSVADALRNVPAVEVDLQGNLSLHGDSNVTILVDGKPSPAFEGKNRADALQQLPADQIERVEVMTNPSVALNPEGSGGVINLITKKSRGGGVTGSAYATAGSAGLKRAGINLGYNSPTLAVTAALSGNYQRNKNHTVLARDAADPISDALLTNVDHSLGRNLNRGPSARLNLTWTPTDKDQVTAAASYTEQVLHGHPDDSYVIGGAGGPTSIFDVHGRRRYLELDNAVSAGWKHTFGEGHELSVDAAYNDSISPDHVLFTVTTALPPAPPLFDLYHDDDNRHHSELRVAYSQKVAGGALKTGYELRHEDEDDDYSDPTGPAPDRLAPRPDLANHYLFLQWVNAVYATYQHGYGPLDVQVGLRAEDVKFDFDQLTSGARDGQHYDKVYPSLHLTWKLDDDRKLSASYAVRVQRPPASILNPLVYMQPGTLDIQVGNPDLRPKETQSFELGYEQHAGQQSYQATLYYRQTQHDFSQVESDIGGGVFETSFLNLGTGHSVGADLSANGKFNAVLSYSLTLSPYWNEIDVGQTNLGVSGQHSIYGLGGRTNLNWQVRPDDMLQLNAIVNGSRVVAQGTLRPIFTLNMGWRHVINERLTATVTGQDLLASNRFHRELNTPTLVEDLVSRPMARSVIFRLDYRFGGGGSKAKEPGFEYENGG